MYFSLDLNRRLNLGNADGIALIREFIKMLDEIPNGGAELLPFEQIDELRNEDSV